MNKRERERERAREREGKPLEIKTVMPIKNHLPLWLIVAGKMTTLAVTPAVMPHYNDGHTV